MSKFEINQNGGFCVIQESCHIGSMLPMWQIASLFLKLQHWAEIGNIGQTYGTLGRY
jgi:hypothetical protein